MNLDRLLPELYEKHLLPFMGNNDMLRLRRVGGRILKENVDDYLRKKSTSTKTYFIGSDNDVATFVTDDGQWNHFEYMDMEDFLRLQLPLQPRRFNLDFILDDKLFTDEKWMVSKFTEDHGKFLTHLTLTELTLPLDSKNAVKFFDTVAPSIRFLAIGAMNFKLDEARAMPPFQNLTTLQIGDLFLKEGNEIAEMEYFWETVQNISNLEAFTFPHTLLLCNLALRTNRRFLELGYQHVASLIDKGLLTNLKSYDLANVLLLHVNLAGDGTFSRFCGFMRARKIKLQNVYGGCFDGISQQELQTIGDVVYSIKEYSLKVGSTQFTNLERVHIETGCSGENNANRHEVFQLSAWPVLKTMILTINSMSVQLLQLLFNREPRPALETLHLCRYASEDVVFNLPAFVNIAKTCPNITKITLQNWVAQDANYAKLWKGLPKLESITLSDCRSIGLGAFTGDKEEKPVFLQLKSLKKLRLIKVHHMRNITDEIFENIFRHLPLKELILDSYDEEHMNELGVESFTKYGILSLTTSDLAKSIEIFPFNCFKLKGSTAQDMMLLGENFRSSQMR